MSSFMCEHCGTHIIDTERGYITECKHYPLKNDGKEVNASGFICELPSLTTDIAVHSKLLELHARALACHCECLGMNAENAAAVCGNYPPPYNEAAYYSAMEKWRLIDKKGKPTV